MTLFKQWQWGRCYAGRRKLQIQLCTLTAGDVQGAGLLVQGEQGQMHRTRARDGDPETDTCQDWGDTCLDWGTRVRIVIECDTMSLKLCCVQYIKTLTKTSLW